MAVIWHKTYQGARYEVRSAGRSRRLYTDGVFHSQYHPQRDLAGGIWDLLWLPAFFRPGAAFRRVLVLGVGGGAAIHLLRRHAGIDEIIGVELNPLHIRLARRFFDLGPDTLQLHQADAVSWLENYRGPRFDLIIEDLFAEQEGEPVRAVSADRRWLGLLERNLQPQGMLVMNFIGRKVLQDCAWFTDAGLRRRFKQAYQFTLPEYENYIAAFLKFEATPQQLRQQLRQQPALNRALNSGKLHYSLRRLRASA